MNASIVTFRANHGKRAVSYVCVAVSAIGVVVGSAMQISDLAVAAAITLATAAATLLVADSIVVDGRRHLIRRRSGMWPLVQEVARPFSEVEYVSIEEVPKLDPDGCEVVFSRLSLVRKFGSPIVLAGVSDATRSLRAEADQLAKLLGVEARIVNSDVRSRISVV